MNKFLASVVGGALAVSAALAGAAQSDPSEGRYWLHPKQGMVKLEPTTSADPGVIAAQASTTGRERAVERASASSANTGTYKWLHPKLGMVTVDRATNAMVISKAAVPATPSN